MGNFILIPSDKPAIDFVHDIIGFFSGIMIYVFYLYLTRNYASIPIFIVIMTLLVIGNYLYHQRKLKRYYNILI